jgi:hypothetical protein
MGHPAAEVSLMDSIDWSIMIDGIRFQEGNQVS